jgi:hypothetical protein
LLHGDMLVVDGYPLLGGPSHATLLPGLAVLIKLKVVQIRLPPALLPDLGDLECRVSPASRTQMTRFFVTVSGHETAISETAKNRLNWRVRAELYTDFALGRCGGKGEGKSRGQMSTKAVCSRERFSTVQERRVASLTTTFDFGNN